MHFQYCFLNNATVKACLESHVVSDTRETCGCHPKCSRTTFDVQTSAAKWPTDMNWRELAKAHNITPPEIPADADNTTRYLMEDIWWKNHVYNSLLKIDIFFRSKGRQVVAEIAKYESHDTFLTDLGGSMSIYMGLSFVVVIEVVIAGCEMTAAGAKWAARIAGKEAK